MHYVTFDVYVQRPLRARTKMRSTKAEGKRFIKKKKKQVLGHALECSKIRWTIQIIFHHSDSVGVK